MEYVFLTAQEALWADVLAQVLRDNAINFTRQPVLGAGLAIKAGTMQEQFRFFVPGSQLEKASELVTALFSGEAELAEEQDL